MSDRTADGAGEGEPGVEVDTCELLRLGSLSKLDGSGSHCNDRVRWRRKKGEERRDVAERRWGVKKGRDRFWTGDGRAVDGQRKKVQGRPLPGASGVIGLPLPRPVEARIK